MPEHAQREIHDFFLFLKTRYIKKQLNQDELETRAFANHSASTIEDWLDANSEYTSNDEYLRSIPCMVQSIQEARSEPIENGVVLDKLILSTATTVD